MISDLCERGACETCFEDELDACGHECHDPTDCPAGEARLTTEYTGTGRAADPADGLPRTVRAARATVPGGPAVLGSPPWTAGGRTSPQLSRERAAAGIPGPETGARPPLLGQAPVRARSKTPAPVTRAVPDHVAARVRVPDNTPAGRTPVSSQVTSVLPDRSRTYTLELPAGLPLLSLNGREHWAARHRKTQALKDAAIVMARKARLPRLQRVSVVAEYQPPDRRRRDADNPVASVKAAIDGIVAAGCLPGDDSPRYVAEVTCRIGELYPKGRLVLHITEVPAATGGEAA